MPYQLVPWRVLHCCSAGSCASWQSKGVLQGKLAPWGGVACHQADPACVFRTAAIDSFGRVPVSGGDPDWIVSMGMLVTSLGIDLMGWFQSVIVGSVVGLAAQDLGIDGSCVDNQARVYAIDPSTRSHMRGQLLLTMCAGAADFTAMISMWWACWGMEGYMRRCVMPGYAGKIE
jgi:hypothetical protein